MRLVYGLAALGLAGTVAGHAAMTYPTPRNAIDAVLPEFKAWAYPCDSTHQGVNCTMTFCGDGRNCQGASPKSAHNGVIDSLISNGQSCYWFSNGCTIGCDACDGTTNHVGHGNQEFLFNGMTSAQLKENDIVIDPWDPKPGDMKIKSLEGIKIAPNCDNPKTKPTICDPRLRTMNTQAECGSPDDIYYWSPWRAPGAAPVIDACGVAGGRHPGMGIGGAGAAYMNTSLSKQGDLGSSLPPMKPQAVWKAGSAVEAGWTVSAHHGGGYAYRIAPAGAPLSEETFQKMPLDFVGNSVLRWGGDKTTQIEFDPVSKGWQTNVGTIPKGSMWRKFPIPTVLWQREGPSFQPVCNETELCKKTVSQYQGYDWTPGTCKCSGFGGAGGPLLPNLEIVDLLQIPIDIPPGDYVLQWRWDCEETAQIWASCADVTITK